MRPIKKLDQFFLYDESIINEEVALANLKKTDIVLEIGAGTGNLTRKLAQKCKVVAIEKDKRLIPSLKEIPNVEVLQGDCLRLMGKIKFSKIVSNIPYSLSKKILLKLLNLKWEKAVLVVQKEFAQKLLSPSKIGAAARDCCNVEIYGYIRPESFTPKAVWSAMIVLDQRKTLDAKYWNFLTHVFRFKNKDVKNVLEKYPKDLEKKKIFQLSDEELRELFGIVDKCL